MPIYEFYTHEDERFIVEIDLPEEEVEKLLDEYRKSDKEYNSDGWAEFLEMEGVKHRFIVVDHAIYF